MTSIKPTENKRELGKVINACINIIEKQDEITNDQQKGITAPLKALRKSLWYTAPEAQYKRWGEFEHIINTGIDPYRQYAFTKVLGEVIMAKKDYKEFLD